MNYGYILYFSDTPVYEIPHDKLGSLMKKLDCLKLTGQSVYILDKDLKKLKEDCELADKCDPTSRIKFTHGKDTSYSDLLDLILDRVRPIKGNMHLFWFHHQGEGSTIEHFGNGSIDFSPVLIVVDKSHPQGPSFLLSSGSREDAVMDRCVWIEDVEEIQALLGRDRNYHYSPKHGNADTPGWPGESRLWSTDDEARKLVKLAIELPDTERTAWIWDPDKKKFLKFFYEGNNPQKQWHGFHIEPTDSEELKKIPNRIKLFFDK